MEGLIFGILRYVYNPRLEVLTFSNKDNLFFCFKSSENAPSNM